MSGTGADHLVQMANDIGHFFESETDREVAVAGIAAHIRRFWEPRMRRKIYAYLEAGGEGLDDLPRTALRQLADKEHAAG